MQFYGSLSVKPELPAEIEGLERISKNLWWCWNPQAEDLFRRIDFKLWKKVNKNPVTVSYTHLTLPTIYSV